MCSVRTRSCTSQSYQCAQRSRSLECRDVAKAKSDSRKISEPPVNVNLYKSSVIFIATEKATKTKLTFSNGYRKNVVVFK